MSFHNHVLGEQVEKERHRRARKVLMRTDEWDMWRDRKKDVDATLDRFFSEPFDSSLK